MRVMHLARLGRGGSLLVGIGNRGRPDRHPGGYQLPDMDGLKLLRDIKRRCPDPPAMMVTAYGMTNAAVVPARSEWAKGPNTMAR
jgi:DNA-binding NtrC family response regulator